MNESEKFYLDGDIPPFYLTGDLRRFAFGEKHVARTANYDVLLIVVCGSLIFYENDERVCLKRGQWYLQRSGFFQEGREASEQPQYYYFHFRGHYKNSAERGIPLRGTIEIQEISPLLERICRVERSSQGTKIDCSAAFYSLLSQLYAQKFIGMQTNPLIQRIESYISENYTQNVTIDQLSQVFKYSGSSIIHQFRRQLGMTPHQYLIQLRVAQASRLLLSSDLSWNDIAEAVGYQDVSTLYRAFVQKMGMSPREWKSKQMVGGEPFMIGKKEYYD